MRAAADSESRENFGDAVRSYKEALKAAPDDPTAVKRSQFVERMDSAYKLLKANKKSEAVREFEAALKIVPDDPAAKKGLEAARR
jgi:hypothetical protein